MATLLAALASPPLVFDFGLEQLVPHQDAEFQRYRVLGQWFGRDDNVVSVFMEDATLFSRGGALRVWRMTEELAASPLVERVASLATVSWVDRQGNEIWMKAPFHPERLAVVDPRKLREPLVPCIRTN